MPSSTNGWLQEVAGIAAVRIAYDASNRPAYVGNAIPGTASTDAGWRIKKLTYDTSGNCTSVTWASVTGGVPAENLVWSNYTGFTYT